MDIDDVLGTPQTGQQALVLALQPGYLGGLRVRFGATSLWGQPGQSKLLALLTSLAQVRPVQPFPTQQGADLAGLGAGIGLYYRHRGIELMGTATSGVRSSHLPRISKVQGTMNTQPPTNMAHPAKSHE